MQNWWRQYFIFNHGERRAIIAIVVFALVAVAGINGYRYFAVTQNAPAPYSNNVDAFVAAYNAAADEEPQQAQRYTNSYTDTASTKPSTAATLFKFDPNTIGVKEWMQLGFSEKQANSIEKYKAKGGTFSKVEDMKKLYVVSDDDYNRIAPYIEIKGGVVITTSTPKQLDLNKADSTSLEALPGIGALLTHRILEQRAKAKYKSVEDLRNIKGMSEENYLKVAPHLKVNQ